MGTEVLVECGVSEGMFSDEAVVEVAKRSFVVPASTVKVMGDKRGRVRARLVKSPDREWIVLPTVYSDSIPISSAVIVKE